MEFHAQNNKMAYCRFYEHLSSVLNLPDFDNAGSPVTYEHLPFTASDISASSFDMSIALPCAENMKLQAPADKTCIALKRINEGSKMV